MKFSGVSGDLKIENISKGYRNDKVILEKGPTNSYHNKLLTNTMQSELSCVVVGGSPNILNYGHGQKIDERDKIIRVNSCNVEGYEKHVGKTTNIWATSLNPAKTFNESRQGNFYFPEEIRDNEVWFRVQVTYKQYMEYVNRWFGTGMNYRILSKKNYSTKENPFTENSSPNTKKFKKRPTITTGTMAVLGALQLYKEVDIVGFTFYNETSSTDNSTYVGITLDENLKRHAKANATLFKPYVEEGRLSFLNDQERENYEKLLKD